MEHINGSITVAILGFFLLNGSMGIAQEANRLDTFSVDTSTFENIKVVKLHSDERSSTFLIWVKNEVRLHKHMEHTENVYVLEGSGLFTLGADQFPIDPGMHIVIPKGVVHSAIVLSEKPMKVLSIQSPEFNGKDRLFLDEE